jgi:hypothetical protein
MRRGLQRIAQSVAWGHWRSRDPAALRRLVAKLLRRRASARHIRWELVPLTPAERVALPPPQCDCRRPSHRFAFHYGEAAAQAEATYDGFSVLLTTAGPQPPPAPRWAWPLPLAGQASERRSPPVGRGTHASGPPRSDAATAAWTSSSGHWHAEQLCKL